MCEVLLFFFTIKTKEIMEVLFSSNENSKVFIFPERKTIFYDHGKSDVFL